MSERKPGHLDDASVFWGAIIGFIVGAVVWLFHVPKRGEDTRKEIVDTGKAIIEQKTEEDSSKKASSSEKRPEYEYFR